MRKFVLIIISLILTATLAVVACAQPVDLVSNTALLNEKLKNLHDKETYNIVIMGDNRSGDAIYAGILYEVNKKNPLFIAHTGDKTYTGLEGDYLNFIRLHESNMLPFFSAAGNHEMNMATSAKYIERYGDKNFDFAVGNNAYIFIDSSRNTIRTKTFEYMEQALKKHAGKRIFLFSHYPTFDPTPSNIPPKVLDKKSTDKFNALLDKYHVPFVFFGHNHIYAHREINGRDEYITGGAGSPLYAKADAGGYYHYLWVTITKDKVKIEVVKYGK